MKSNFKKKYNLLDIEAQNAFSTNESISKMKYYYRFNTIRVQDNIINNRISTVEYPRCSKDKT